MNDSPDKQMAQLRIGYEEGSTRFGVRELKCSEDRLKSFFSCELESCSLFLMPADKSDQGSIPAYDIFLKELSFSLAFQRGTEDLSSVLPDSSGFNNCQLHYLVFESIEPGYVKQVLLDVLRKISGINHRSIRYNKYGLFIPRAGRIICFSFAHSGSMYYRYRLAEFKLKTLPAGLSNYLGSLLKYCPHEYFFSGSRASGFIMNLKAPVTHFPFHSICLLAEEALKAGRLRSGHENVEKFLLESDPATIACEVPVWYQQPQNGKLNIEGVLTGHIDILRYEKDGMIGIWDYKPRARYERKAHMQVYLYALMLSQRTGIPLSNFLCGYFDSTDAYIFPAGQVDC